MEIQLNKEKLRTDNEVMPPPPNIISSESAENLPLESQGTSSSSSSSSTNSEFDMVKVNQKIKEMNLFLTFLQLCVTAMFIEK